MRPNLEQGLVIGISARALFDLRAEAEIFKAGCSANHKETV